MMHNPAHPGEILRIEVFSELGVSVAQASRTLGISRGFLSRVLHEKAGISPDLALRLEASGLGSARMWLSMQIERDLWVLRQQPRPVVGRFDVPSMASPEEATD